jgi:archaellum component FlaC
MADKTLNLVATLQENVTDKLQEIQKSAEKAKASLEGLDDTLDDVGRSLSGVEDELEEVGTELTETGIQAQAATASVQELRASLESLPREVTTRIRVSDASIASQWAKVQSAFLASPLLVRARFLEGDIDVPDSFEIPVEFDVDEERMEIFKVLARRAQEAEESVEHVSESFEGARESVKHASESFEGARESVEHASESFEEARESVDRFTDGAGGSFNELSDEVNDVLFSVEELGTALGKLEKDDDFLSFRKLRVSSASAEAIDELGDSFENATKRGDGFLDTIGDIGSSVSRILGGSGGDGGSPLGGLAGPLDDINDALSKVGVNLGPISTKLGGIGQALGAIVVTLGSLTAIVSNLASVVAGLTGFVGTLIGGGLEKAERLQQQFEGITSTAEAFQALLSAIQRALGEAIEPLQNEDSLAVFEDLLQLVVFVVDGFAQMLAPLIDIDDSSNDILGTFRSIDDAVRKNLGPIMGELSLLIQQSLPLIEGMLKAFLRALPDVLQFFRKMTEDSGELGKTVMLLAGILADIGAISVRILSILAPGLNLILGVVKLITGVLKFGADLLLSWVRIVGSVLRMILPVEEGFKSIAGWLGVGTSKLDELNDYLDITFFITDQIADSFERMVRLVSELGIGALREMGVEISEGTVNVGREQVFEQTQQISRDSVAPEVVVQEGDVVQGNKIASQKNTTNVDARPEDKERMKRLVKGAMKEANTFRRRSQGH